MGIARFTCAALVLSCAMLFLPAMAEAERTHVDWQRGLLIGRGIAVGDLRSPSRQLARVKAERQARARCRALLLESVGSLRWAQGKQEGGPLPASAEVASLGESIFSINTDFGTDGSVVAEMALPLDALRSLVQGPDKIRSGPSEAPAALVVDARRLGLKPALGFLLSDGTTTYSGPTLFFESETQARLHPGIGTDAPLIVARASSVKERKSGVIAVESGTLMALLASQPLVAILWSSGR